MSRRRGGRRLEVGCPLFSEDDAVVTEDSIKIFRFGGSTEQPAAAAMADIGEDVLFRDHERRDLRWRGLEDGQCRPCHVFSGVLLSWYQISNRVQKNGGLTDV